MVFSLQKVQKNTVQSTIATTHIQQKLKVGHFHFFLKILKYKICPKFWTCPNKSTVYGPGIRNLQSRTVSLSDQKTLLEKVDDGQTYIFINAKTKTRKLNTKNPQIADVQNML